METKTYHGKLTPGDIGRALVAEFDHGNLQANLIESPERVLVQIASRTFRSSGGQTSLTVTLEKIEDGVMVQVGDQQMLGVAADLGATALSALRNPINLIGRLNSLAEDINALQLSDSHLANRSKGRLRRRRGSADFGPATQAGMQLLRRRGAGGPARLPDVRRPAGRRPTQGLPELRFHPAGGCDRLSQLPYPTNLRS